MLPSSFTLALILAGLTTGLLTLAGATLLERTSAIDTEPWPGCVAMQIGSMNAARTRIHLANVGAESIRVRFDWVDDYGGLKLPTADYSRSIDPWTSADILIKAPGPGAVVKVNSSRTNLHASAEVQRDDGGSVESRHAYLCFAQQAPTGSTR
jgi:hypothetical protein